MLAWLALVRLREGYFSLAGCTSTLSYITKTPSCHDSRAHWAVISMLWRGQHSKRCPYLRVITTSHCDDTSDDAAGDDAAGDDEAGEISSSGGPIMDGCHLLVARLLSAVGLSPGCHLLKVHHLSVFVTSHQHRKITDLDDSAKNEARS